jgi:hypothetical protein
VALIPTPGWRSSHYARLGDPADEVALQFDQNGLLPGQRADILARLPRGRQQSRAAKSRH